MRLVPLPGSANHIYATASSFPETGGVRAPGTSLTLRLGNGAVAWAALRARVRRLQVATSACGRTCHSLAAPWTAAKSPLQSLAVPWGPDERTADL